MAKTIAKTMKKSKYVTKSDVRNMLESQLEKKRIVQTSSGTVATAGTIIYYSAIAQGDALNERAGMKILVKELSWTFAYSDNVTGVARFLLVQDTSNTGVAPTVTEILSSATVQAHLNPTYHLQNRYKVLVDKTMTTSVAGEQYHNKLGRAVVKLPVFYNGTTTASSSGGKNSLYLLIIGGQATGAYVVNIDIAYTDA